MSYQGPFEPPGPTSPGQPDPGQPQPGPPGYPPQYGPPAPYGYPPVPRNPNRTLATVGLSLAGGGGLLSLAIIFVGLPVSVAGLIVSIVALVRARRDGTPRGLALAGVLVGAGVLVLAILLVTVFAVYLASLRR